MTQVRSERGVALMLVLWLIVVLAAVAAAAVSTVRRQSDVVVNLRTRATARAAALIEGRDFLLLLAEFGAQSTVFVGIRLEIVEFLFDLRQLSK